LTCSEGLHENGVALGGQWTDLEQNAPNLILGTTIIRYHVSENSASVRLTLTNAKGQVLKTIAIAKGSRQLNLNTAALAAGGYSYTLFVDGKQADTKRFVVAR
jgi:hypothetical protein